jgi:hypothetical protein
MSRDPGWAECFVPMQSIDIGNVIIDEPKKATGPGIPPYAADRLLAPLSYKDPAFNMPTLAVLTPFLTVQSWDSSTGRLDLDLDLKSTIGMKCMALQEYALSLLKAHPLWFPIQQRTADQITSSFQQMIQGNTMTIYLHGPNPENRQTGRVWLWKAHTWQKGAAPSSFKRGQRIRVALRFQGICFLKTLVGRVKCRFQHQTIAIIHELTA